MTYLIVFLGGGLGAALRHGINILSLRWLGTAFPYGTLAVNVIGSFLLGAIMQVGLNTTLLSPDARLVLGTGVMGGFTTYSTFNYETLRYMQEGAWGLAGLNLSVTVVTCLVAGVLGTAAARVMVG